MAQFDVNWSAPISPLAGTVSAGQCLVDDGTGRYIVATTANRGSKRCDGIAMTAGDSSNPVVLLQVGPVSRSVITLGAGTASAVRCSTTGALERCTPGAGDDIVGRCEADGYFHAAFGFVDPAWNASSGGFTAPTGTGFVTVTAGSLDVASRAVGANVYTFLGTPSGANLAAALTSALPVSKGGTGLTALTIPASGLLVGTTDTQTLTGKTIGGQLQGAAVAMGASAIDWSLGTVFTKTLSAGANTFTFSNQASGMVITVRVTGAASTLTWPTVKWAGGAAPTQTASGTDVYTFIHDGTSVYGSVVQAMA